MRELDYTNSGDPTNLYHNDGKGRIIGSTWGGVELKLYASYSFIAPFLTAEHFLFSDNNIKLTFLGELSPVSMNAGMSIVWTPIAFLNFGAGFLIGSGWNFAGLFNGLGRNINGDIKSEPFYGPVMQIWFNSTLMFDVAAVLPENLKRWTHIVMVVKPEFKYKALLTVNDSQPFLWEADEGENLNGFIFKSSFFLGYQIPVIEDDTGENKTFIRMKHKRFKITTGFLTSIDPLSLTHYNDSTMANKGWGSDFCYVEFGPIMGFELPNNFYVNLFLFWKNEKIWSKDTVGNLFYQDRKYEDWAVYFRRFAFVFGWNF